MENIQVNEEKNLSSDAGQVSASRSGHASIRRTMRGLVSDCVDISTNEVNTTQLAENTAHALNHDEWLDDSNHALWDFAIDIAEAYERRSA